MKIIWKIKRDVTIWKLRKIVIEAWVEGHLRERTLMFLPLFRKNLKAKLRWKKARIAERVEAFEEFCK